MHDRRGFRDSALQAVTSESFFVLPIFLPRILRAAAVHFSALRFNLCAAGCYRFTTRLSGLFHTFNHVWFPEFKAVELTACCKVFVPKPLMNQGRALNRCVL
jgi:hypothetical protein